METIILISVFINSRCGCISYDYCGYVYEVEQKGWERNVQQRDNRFNQFN